MTPTLGALEIVEGGSITGAFDPDAYGNVNAVVDRAGVVTALWQRDITLRVSQRSRTGQWAAPRQLGCSFTPTCAIGYHDITVDGAGTVTAVWEQEMGRNMHIYVATKPRRESWSAPTRLTGGQRFPGGSEPTVTASQNGALLVTFDDYLRGQGWVVAAIYRPRGAAWSQVRRTRFRKAWEATTSMDASGHAVMVVRRPPNPNGQVRAYRFAPTTGWSRPKTLGGSYERAFSVAMAPGGRAVAAWSHGEYRQTVQARVLTRTGRWGPRRNLVPARSDYVGQPLVVVDALRATVVWGNDASDIVTSTRARNGPWRTSTVYRRDGALRSVDSNARGDLSMLVERWIGDEPRLFASLRPRGADWTSQVRVPATYVGENVGAFGAAPVLPHGTGLVITSNTAKRNRFIIARPVTRGR